MNDRPNVKRILGGALLSGCIAVAGPALTAGAAHGHPGPVPLHPGPLTTDDNGWGPPKQWWDGDNPPPKPPGSGYQPPPPLPPGLCWPTGGSFIPLPIPC
jgi:hypothetical protein